MPEILDSDFAGPLESDRAGAPSDAMSRETSEALKGELGTAFTDGSRLSDEPEDLAARLAIVERAYEELLARVRGYEHERVEIRNRLERILAQIARTAATRS